MERKKIKKCKSCSNNSQTEYDMNGRVISEINDDATLSYAYVEYDKYAMRSDNNGNCSLIINDKNDHKFIVNLIYDNSEYQIETDNDGYVLGAKLLNSTNSQYGSIVCKYSPKGNITNIKENGEYIFKYRYNSKNLIIREEYPGCEMILCTKYNNNDKPVYKYSPIENDNYKEYFEYDESGMLRKHITDCDLGIHTVEYEYNENGDISKEKIYDHNDIFEEKYEYEYFED